MTHQASLPDHDGQRRSSTAVPPAPALEVRSLHITFRERRSEVHVLDGLSLQVQPGEFVSLIGPSGSGKSTLFHIIGGLTAPDAGSVLMDGQDVTGEKGRIAYMPQQPALFPWRTVEDNVLLPEELRGASKTAARENARSWMERAGLAGFEKAYPHTLSGGMQQRAAFLRALMSPQEVMCLDEPFSALDALTRSDMQRWLLDIWEDTRRSVLMITHHIEEALLLSDSIYILSARPGTILKRVEVPFPRPRREDILNDPSFISLKTEISAIMREEQHKH
ncbi:ABC transporter ATP-binding protein [Paenibacillus lautus]|jgi:ABC-type nitrate/sulfonate/bicarbonate transport system ATPase subunit|uniref:ABC transporter ATP-binding protein n=1 Tax=Paenibacillus lautus TaxID=1401 RepID=A0A385TZB4_PAELA|nr:ABC transporter ATP-binding protein [Paenibacillus lautus]AYB46645.1 ABC transporter ATP-binding protein [Paenibacillus lautus]MBY0164335.1 ABC transporter ATP-binding protein [Cytobacillus firmus]MCI1775451.1 ABC transporter ATP-binding protein [Paenibacillus lautus]